MRERVGTTGSSDHAMDDWSLLGVNGKGAMVVLMKVHQPCYSASVLKRYDQHRVISILFTLGILWYPCCVHHTAFLWINSRWLISLTLFGSETNAFQDLSFTKEELIFRVLINKPWALVLALLVMLMWVSQKVSAVSRSV